ncbi:MAG: hypothetical protein ACE1ZG_00710, partial [Gammaproteobacteria bacterium]
DKCGVIGSINCRYGGKVFSSRMTTPESVPYLGQLKDYENVYINAGHFRKGILQAPVCARKIAEMVC